MVLIVCKMFNELFGKCLSLLGFEQSKCEANICIRDYGNCYNYIASYVDDLAIFIKNPDKFLKQLQGKPFNFKKVECIPAD